MKYADKERNGIINNTTYLHKEGKVAAALRRSAQASPLWRVGLSVCLCECSFRRVQLSACTHTLSDSHTSHSLPTGDPACLPPCLSASLRHCAPSGWSLCPRNKRCSQSVIHSSNLTRTESHVLSLIRPSVAHSFTHSHALSCTYSHRSGSVRVGTLENEEPTPPPDSSDQIKEVTPAAPTNAAVLTRSHTHAMRPPS